MNASVLWHILETEWSFLVRLGLLAHGSGWVWPSPFPFIKGFEEPVTCPPDYVPQWMGNCHAEMGGKFCYLYMETTAKVNNPRFSNNHI